MNKYTIPCTKEQTLKALKLGAPISNHIIDSYYANCLPKPWFYKDGNCYQTPTTEQMLGWLRENDLYINITHISAGYTSWVKTVKENITLSEGNTGYVNSFEEATLNGINKALEYLENKTMEE